MPRAKFRVKGLLTNKSTPTEFCEQQQHKCEEGREQSVEFAQMVVGEIRVDYRRELVDDRHPIFINALISFYHV